MPDLDRDGTRYLVIIQLTPSTPARLLKDVPKLKEYLSRASSELAFRSPDGGNFAYGIRAKVSAKAIKEGLTTSMILTNQDSILVLEIGEGHAGQGFGRFETWIDRH